MKFEPMLEHYSIWLKHVLPFWSFQMVRVLHKIREPADLENSILWDMGSMIIIYKFHVAIALNHINPIILLVDSSNDERSLCNYMKHETMIIL